MIRLGGGGDGVGTHPDAPFLAGRALAEGSGQLGPLQPQTGPHRAHHPGLPENRLGAFESGVGAEKEDYGF